MSNINQAFIRAYSKNKSPQRGDLASRGSKPSREAFEEHAQPVSLRSDSVQPIPAPHITNDLWTTTYSTLQNVPFNQSDEQNPPSSNVAVDHYHAGVPSPHAHEPTIKTESQSGSPSSQGQRHTAASDRKTLSSYLQQARSGVSTGASEPTRHELKSFVTNHSARLYRPESKTERTEQPGKAVAKPEKPLPDAVSQVWYQEAWMATGNTSSETVAIAPLMTPEFARKQPDPINANNTAYSPTTLAAIQKVETLKAAMEKLSDKMDNLAGKSHTESRANFQAVWEVDRFYWPDVTAVLSQDSGFELSSIGGHLATANKTGLKTMLVTSMDRGEGRSTVAMCLAKIASRAGLRVALVDGDLSNPTLVDHLNLETTHAWTESILDGLTLEEAAIHSIQDQITLLPLVADIDDRQLRKKQSRIVAIIDQLSQAFDMVIIDGDPINALGFTLLDVASSSSIDSAVLVVDRRERLSREIDDAVRLVRQRGIHSVGIVENFQ